MSQQSSSAGSTYTADESTLTESNKQFSVKALGIDSAQIAANAVTTAKLASGVAGLGNILINPAHGGTSIQGTWTNVIDATAPCNQQFYNSSGTAQNDEISYPVYLEVGTYSLFISMSTDASRAIQTVKINDATVGTIDGYSATLTANVTKSITGISVTARGLTTLKFKGATRNASANNWIVLFSSITLVRTA